MNSEELLIKGLDELGLSYTSKQATDLMTLLSELKKWNRAYNLTSLKKDSTIIIRHFLDSLLYLKVLPESAGRVADFGSGAGFPGIPIKIIRPEIEMTLVESSRKKAAFLRHIIRILDITGIKVLQKRTEDIGEDLQKYFDVIVSRATFNIIDFLKTACPYLKQDGVMIMNKGPNYSEELKGIVSVEDVIKEIKKVELPVERADRNLIVLCCK